MAATEFVIMPSADYQAICNGVRGFIGATELLKSGDIADLMATEVRMEAELLNAGGAYPVVAPFAKVAYIPEDAEYIDLDVFRNMLSVDTVYLRANCDFETVSEMDSSTKTTVYYNALVKGGIYLKKLIIGGAYETLPDYFGRGLSFIEEIVFEDGVVNIGSYAFKGCAELASVIIPTSVTNIGSYAFKGCAELASVTIPTSVTNIGSYAFEGCNALSRVTIPTGVVEIGVGAFRDCDNLAEVVIEDGLTVIQGSVFAWCYNLQKITIPTSVTTIDSGGGGGATIPATTVIRGYAGSYAETYATTKGYTFEVIE